MPRPGFEPGLLRPQRSVLTTRRSRLSYAGSDTYSVQNLMLLTQDKTSFSFLRHPASRGFFLAWLLVFTYSFVPLVCRVVGFFSSLGTNDKRHEQLRKYWKPYQKENSVRTVSTAPERVKKGPVYRKSWYLPSPIWKLVENSPYQSHKNISHV